jgi:hypothetical protein
VKVNLYGLGCYVQNRCRTLELLFCLLVEDNFSQTFDFILLCLYFKMHDRRVIISTMNLK